MTKNDEPSLERLTTTIYLIEGKSDYSIISTKQPIKKYVSNVMKRNKGNIVLQNILKDDYTYKILIEKFLYDSKEQLNYKIELLKFEYKKNKQTEQKNNVDNSWIDYLDRLKYCHTEEEINQFMKTVLTIISAKGW